MAAFFVFYWKITIILITLNCTSGFHSNDPPKISPATGLENRIYKWKFDQQIRYQVNGPDDGIPVILIHGLFCNSDHWRKTLVNAAAPSADTPKYKAYALDLYGCGYSAKPFRETDVAQQTNGEQERFPTASDSILKNVKLGTADGKGNRIRDVDLKHPLDSPYNFFTWANLINDFCRDVVLKDSSMNKQQQHAVLVCNSIGTISALQAVIDQPDLYRGVMVIAPNFRELHSAEVPYSKFAMPIIRFQQAWLRDQGQGLFDALAKPATVKNILKVPYAVKEQVDDTLVQVLLDPLLTEGASRVVFDTLSYSAGPLPEQQLQTFPANKPVWVCYGHEDPWTPAARVEALTQYSPVERVTGWAGVGHCPMDERADLVHDMLYEFLERLQSNGADEVLVKSIMTGEGKSI
ncbi:hypothetical protein MPSEU_000784000 [Mayamaea pseudoterrestris]|nr:hypothetical protein MPSEU_000784000 [Mayamaea pseudoterrestris]